MKSTNPMLSSWLRSKPSLALLSIGLYLFSGPRLLAAEGDAAPLVLEAEAGILAGNLLVQKGDASCPTTTSVGGFESDGDKLTLPVEAPAGIYTLSIYYRSALKGFQVQVNDLVLSGKFMDSGGAFMRHDLGKLRLQEGGNTLSIFGGWNQYEIDRVELNRTLGEEPLRKPSPTLCNVNSTTPTRELMAYLNAQYGERTLSGTIEGPDVDYVEALTGESPAIIAGDLMNVNLTTIRYAGVSLGDTERLIERAKQGHIVTLCWHWRPPTGVLNTVLKMPDGSEKGAQWYKSFYTYATTFDVEAVLAHPESKEYTLLMADIDMVAGELGKLSARGIPVLWRPLHEAEGKWFWWGAKGPQPYVKLWRLVYERLTKYHHLNNLIWVYTGTATSEWYPGDDVVDIIGIDDYPSDVRDPLSATWEAVQKQFGDQKLIALSEFGGVPDLESARDLGVRWSYFASWSNELGPKKMDKEALRRIYTSPRVINLKDLPKDRWAPHEEIPR